MEKKVCTKCNKEKNLTEYYKQGGGHKAACKECAKAYSKKWQKENPEKVKAQRKSIDKRMQKMKKPIRKSIDKRMRKK